MNISVRETSDLASAMEITKYPNSPLIKSVKGSSVLVVFDGYNEYILGYITKGDTSNNVIVYSQMFSGSYGHTLNDIYNNVQNPNDVSLTQSKKKRTLLLGENIFIGSEFHDGIDGTHYGFSNKSFYQIKDYEGDSGEEAPVSPMATDRAKFSLMMGGNKQYHSSSGSLQEANAIRINIGVSGTDIHSYGIWDKSNLKVETPIERTIRSMAGITYASGSRSGSVGAFPEIGTYHIYNFLDNSSFFIGKGIIEIEKSNNDNTIYSKTVYDENGVLIEVDQNSVITMKVEAGANTTELIITENNVHIKGATLNYDGDLYVSGLLHVSGAATVDGATILADTLDVKSGKVVVNAAGKFLTTGGNALA